MAHDGTLEGCDDTQLELFDGEAAGPLGPDPAEMRRWLLSLLDEVRGAETLPWPRVNATLYRALVPHIAQWLPEDEGAQLRFEFESELARLEAA
jgi:hypothetical protein